MRQSNLREVSENMEIFIAAQPNDVEYETKLQENWIRMSREKMTSCTNLELVYLTLPWEKDFHLWQKIIFQKSPSSLIT